MRSLLLLFLLSLHVRGFGDPTTFLRVNLHSYDCGMFSVCNYVVGLLHHYDTDQFSGIEVDFENLGLYYQQERGSNWWNYYFEPIALGNKNRATIKQFDINEYSHYAYYTENRLTRQQVFEIIQKYIKIRDPIQKKVEEFVQQNFSGHHIISVHFRGTDKSVEAPRVSIDQVVACIEKYVKTYQVETYKIFVASDEESFVTQMNDFFPGLVIASHSKRSVDGRPLHYGNAKQDCYQAGEEALIDCLLLCRGNVLIRTSSNLSLWSTYFNPEMLVFELNQRK